MHPILDEARSRRMVLIVTPDLHRAGITDAEVRRKVRRGEWVRLRRGVLAAADITRRRGIPVTTLPRTLVDLARTLPLTDAVVAADAALHRLPDLVTPELLRTAAGAATGWTHAADARRLADLAVEHVESPLETRHRLALLRSRVPLPRRGMRIDLPGDHFYPHGLWEAAGVVQETDGRVKTLDPWDGRTAEQKGWAEKRRAETMTAAGVRFWRVAEEDLEPRAWSRAVDRLLGMLAHPLPGPRRYTAVFAPRPSAH